uniref:Putative secreted peptide n=1 Tax=Anopheles braziliensis TaxID=58242 RepID=A0A2M3ZWW2_9DIPT
MNLGFKISKPFTRGALRLALLVLGAMSSSSESSNSSSSSSSSECNGIRHLTNLFDTCNLLETFFFASRGFVLSMLWYYFS